MLMVSLMSITFRSVQAIRYSIGDMPSFISDIGASIGETTNFTGDIGASIGDMPSFISDIGAFTRDSRYSTSTNTNLHCYDAKMHNIVTKFPFPPFKNSQYQCVLNTMSIDEKLARFLLRVFV